MHKTNSMKVLKILQHGKYLVAYVLNTLLLLKQIKRNWTSFSSSCAIGKLWLNSKNKPQMYVRRSTMYEKAQFSLAGTGARKNSTVACPIKIRYCDYLKRFINRINEVYVFFIKI